MIHAAILAIALAATSADEKSLGVYVVGNSATATTTGIR
jgi:hypothetical protein